jgi:hypothetical protein
MSKNVLLLVVLNAATAQAAPIYKCVDAQGATSFQSVPCPGKATQTEVVLGREAMPPAPEPKAEAESERPNPPDAGTSSRLERLQGPQPTPPPPAQAAAPPAAEKVSYQCTAQDGSVFYTHQPCPSRIRSGTSTTVSDVGGAHRVSTDGNYLQVTQKTVSRELACREMRKPSASDRQGYAYDQKTATYDKLVGRDPCG